MVLAEYVGKLVKLVKAGHGKKEVYYSIDEEGNDFQPVQYEPSVMVNENDGREMVCIN